MAMVEGRGKILIVDDDERTLKLMARLLRSSGFDCVTAGSAADAMAQLGGEPDVDVVLSDIYMPTTDGLEFLAQVRDRHGDRPWLQLILITGQGSLETAIAAMRLDASDYLLKPVEPKALRETVEHAIARARSIREVQQAEAGSASGEEVRKLADVARDLAGHLRRSGTGPGDGSVERESLRLLQRLQEARSTVFGQAVMPEPAWEMLAELMRARLAGQHVSVTSLALASASPTTTALRRIEELIQGGLVVRVPDPSDKRRTYVELTPSGVTRMQLFLEGFSRIVHHDAGQV
jgi:DNA-binding response OmpR family regulator